MGIFAEYENFGMTLFCSPDFIFYFFVILLLTIVTRFLPRIWIKNPTATDTYYHLFIADEIRKNNFSAPWTVDRAVLNYGFQYPYLYHKIVSIFPKEWAFRLEKLFSPFWEAASVAVFGLILIYFNENGIIDWEPREILMGMLLFSLSPALLRYGYGPRAYHGTPRVFGQFLYICQLFSFFIWWKDKELLPLFISSALVGFIAIGSNFTSQVLWFFAPFIIVIFSPAYIITLLLGLIFGMIISKGRLYFVYEAHIKYTLFYKNHLQNVYLHNSTFIRGFKEYLISLKEKIFKYSLRDWFYMIRKKAAKDTFYLILKYLIKERYFLHQLILYYHLMLIGVFFLFTVNPEGTYLKQEIRLFFISLILGGVFMYILTSLKQFLFIGENERYLEYIVFVGIILSYKFWSNFSIFIALIIIYFLFFVANVWLVVKEEKTLSDAIPSLKNTLASLPDSEFKVLYPLGWFFWPALYFYKGPVLTASALFNPDRHSFYYYNLLYTHFPFPGKDLEKLLKSFNVFYILSTKEDLQFYLSQYPQNEKVLLDRFVLVDTIKIFNLYKIKNE